MDEMEQGKMLAKIKELGYKVEFGRYEYWEDIPYVEHNDGSRTFLAKTYYAYGSLGIATDVPFTKAKKAIRMKEKNINAIEDIEIRMEANVVTDFYDIIIGVKEASELWDLSLDHVKKLCKDGDIVAKKVGETWVVLKDQGNPKVYKKEMNKMENIKIIIAGIEAGEVEFEEVLFEDIVRVYEQVAYADTDRELRPADVEDVFKKDLLNSIDYDLEQVDGKMIDMFDSLTFGFLNRDTDESNFLRIYLEIEKTGESNFEIKATSYKTFSETN